MRYMERDAGPDNQTRGEALEAVAGGDYWVFLTLAEDQAGGLALKMDLDDRLSTEALRALLEKTLEALP